MKVAFGMKAHSGWAALVVIGKRDGHYVVVDRRRVELVDNEWGKQPYHAAEDLKPQAARNLVKRGIEAAHRNAVREMRASVKREQALQNSVSACAVLMGNPMPGWSTEQILAVHFRMHQAEGVLFREALATAATKCKLKLVAIPEKTLAEHAERTLRTSFASLKKTIASLGKSVGPPWTSDQKDASLAAMIALQ